MKLKIISFIVLALFVSMFVFQGLVAQDAAKDSTKTCCEKVIASCKTDSAKACCKEIVKKVCQSDSTKPCCKKEVKKCAEDCQKACCKKADKKEDTQE